MLKSFRQVVLFMTLLGCATTSGAKEGDFAAYFVASQQFSELVAEAALQKRAPRATQPPVARVLAILTDHRRFLESRNFSSHDFDAVMDMCEAAHRAASAYYFFGVGSNLNKSTTSPAHVAEIALLRKRNAIKYQNEMIGLLSFAHKCWSKSLPLLVNFVKTLKPEEFNTTRREGLAQIRRGVATGYVGLAEAYAGSSISLQNRRKLLAVMAEVSPIYAQVLDLPKRRQVHEYLLSVASVMPAEFSSQFRLISKSMSSDICEGLCRL